MASNPDIIVNKLLCNREDGRLLTSLTYVFGSADPSEELIEDASGHGTTLLAALYARAKLASVPDKAVVHSTFNRIKSEGIHGEMSISSLSSFVKRYHKAKTDLEPALRTALCADEVEV